MKEEDGLELIEIESVSSSSTFVKKLKKPKANRVGSPPADDYQIVEPKINSDVSHLFVVEKRNDSPQTIRDRGSLSEDCLSNKTYEIRSIKSDEESYRSKLRTRFKKIKDKTGRFINKNEPSNFVNRRRDELSRQKKYVDEEKQNYESGEESCEIDPYKFFCSNDSSGLQVSETNNGEALVKLLPYSKFESLGSNTESAFWNPRRTNLCGQLAKEDIVKQRLSVLENHEKWFDAEGNLMKLPNPYLPYSYRLKIDDDTKFTKFVAAKVDDFENPEGILIDSETTLLLHIFEVKFKYHPLFSVEHLIQSKLYEVYETYNKQKAENVVETLSQKLNSLRRNKVDLKELEGVEKCVEEIAEVREKLFEESRKERDSLLVVLEVWKALKKIRKINGYSSTKAKLIILKSKCYAVNQEELNQRIEEVVREVLEEMNVEYNKKLKQYKHNLQAWKNNLANEVNSEPLKKPKKPINDVDEEEIRETIRKKFKKSFPSPGEPNIQIRLTDDNLITENIENPKESLRRAAANSTKLHLKIFGDSSEICRTKTVPLTDNFTCNFDELFSVNLSFALEKLSLKFVEQTSSLAKRTYSDCVLILSDTLGEFQEDKDAVECSFRHEREIIHYKHDGLGSGTNVNDALEAYELNIDCFEDDVLFTKGTVEYNIGWKVSRGAPSNLIVNKIATEDFFNDIGSINVEFLMGYIRENGSEDLLKAVESYENKKSVEHKYYRVSHPQMKPLQFCSFSEIENNIRFQMLHLRDRNEPEFIGIVVPNRLKEIPVNILQDYKQRKNKEQDRFELDEEISLELRRSYCWKYLNRFYMKIFQQCRCSKNNLLFEDVVDEKYLANFQFYVRILIFNILNYFKFEPYKWKIFPVVHKYKNKNEEEKSRQQSAVKIVINVLCALNLPERNDDSGEVTAFVECTFKSSAVQSSTSFGVNPIWNQELVIPLESSHTDYLNPDSLNDNLKIYVYDDIKSLVSRNLLGFIEIPISALNNNNNMTGLFQLKTPEISTNYKTDPKQQPSLQMELYLNPGIPKFTPSLDVWSTSELPYIKDYISKWNEIYNSNFPTRKFSALVIGLNAKTACITRYLRPLDPPQLHGSLDVTPEMCARYVSLIPFTNCNKFYQNVCLTTEKLLTFMIGSVVDHAIALTCYFLALKLDAWLVFGYGIPDGTTAYVLVKSVSQETNTPILHVYDVKTGCKFVFDDMACPLQKAFCLVNEHNVLANIQRNDFLRSTRFDFTRRSDWLPLFDETNPSPSNSVQKKLIYLPEENVQLLELKIDKKIRKKFMKLRQLQRTIWNRKIASMGRNILKKLETDCMKGKSHAEAHTELLKTFSELEITGCFFSMPFTTISDIIDRITPFGFHLCEDENLEFVLAVYIQSYASQVVVVWIFIAVVKINSK